MIESAPSAGRSGPDQYGAERGIPQLAPHAVLQHLNKRHRPRIVGIMGDK
jgi:truncated hemoglobin YjbI